MGTYTSFWRIFIIFCCVCLTLRYVPLVLRNDTNQNIRLYIEQAEIMLPPQTAYELDYPIGTVIYAQRGGEMPKAVLTIQANMAHKTYNLSSLF
jgi:hypothetical protein